MNKNVYRILGIFIFMLLLEVLFIVFSGIGFNNFIYKLLFSLLSSLCINLVFIFKNKTNKLIYFVICFLLVLLFVLQFIYFNVFDNLLSISSVFNSTDIGKFSNSIFNVIISRWYVILSYIFIYVCLFFCFKEDYFEKNDKKNYFINFGSFIVLYLIIIICVFFSNDGLYCSMNLYFNINVPRENIKTFGVLTSTRLDVQRSIFGFKEKNLFSYEDLDGNSYVIDKDRYNILDIDFEKSINSDDKVISEISSYLNKQSPSKKNKYTGLFKDKNLIFIVGESFSSLSIDKKLTPTLYKMVNGGITFNNFYNPLYPVSTADGQYMLDTGLVPAEGTWSILDVHDKYYPYTYGNIFKSLGYSTYAFHNYDYDYYDRDKYFETMGFEKYLGNGNGLEDYMDFSLRPSSDYDMFKSTFDIYSNDDKFLAYFITMSGHRDYNMKHSIVKKNWDKVKNLNYSDKAKAYLATQIELDKAMEILLKKLDDKGILKNTVIVLTGDHYPYGLTEKEQKELMTNRNDDYLFERFHSPLIIYNNEVDIECDKYSFSMDVLPTVLNLFGIEYDSRLLMGRDIMSDYQDFVIFSDRSFITDKGKYYNDYNKFVAYDSKFNDDEYVSYIKNLIYLKYRNSRLILESDYYNELFN